jgi:hypothetical protein
LISIGSTQLTPPAAVAAATVAVMSPVCKYVVQPSGERISGVLPIKPATGLPSLNALT